MARKKGPVIGWEEDPKPEEAAPGVDTLETPSGFFSTFSPTSTCPHCNSTFQDLSIADFRDHVATCTRPSTADDDATSGSSLSTPPASPSQLLTSSNTVNEPKKEAEDVVEKLPEDKVRELDLEVVIEPTIDAQLVDHETVGKDPRPYLNPLVDFDYYDQSEPQEGSDADQNPPEPTDKFPFPKVTDVEVFEGYLKDAEDMSYDELYRRTAIVSDNLVVYQAEWDAIDKEIFEHETYLRSEEKRIEEETKAALEEDRLIEDEERDRVDAEFKDQLKLNGKKWQEFLAEFESENPNDTSTMRHLQNLRNPQFMAAARKKKRTVENRQKTLLNAPWPEVKKTKEDLEVEKRKRGRYMDPVKFDDMKQADVYGFEYSAHIKHYGQQPMATVARQIYSNMNPTSNPFGDDTNDASRTRTQRKQTRKVYEAEASVTPEDSETDGKLPLKRARKPKIFIDGVETLERSRGQSRSGTPAVRTFASGKRVGRPPAKSKLQAVQLAQPSETPEVASGSDAQIPDSVSGLIQDNDGESRELAPSQEAQLHDAAESLVNQTHTDQVAAALPAVKPKHPGGRPRKIRTDSSMSGALAEVQAPDISQPKPRHKGGRPRKHPVPFEAEYLAFETQEPQALKSKPKKKRGDRRVKREAIPDEELQLGEENGVLQSTEQDDGSQYTSGATTRPTTSDSNATVSTFASRRSARPTTRDKTNAREARATTLNRRDSIQGPTVSAPTSGRSKRKRNSSDTDPSPIVVQPAFIPVAETTTKKRKARTKQDSNDVIEALPETIPEVPMGRFKRKRGDTINESIAVVGPAAPIDLAPAPKKRRRGVKVEEKEEPEVEEEDSDAGIDEELLDPIAREALRKKRVKKEKSRKLSKNMKARWASGGMKEAQETRKTNNAIKRSWKQQALANEAAGLPPPPQPVLIGTAPNSAPASAPAQTEPEAEPETPVDTPATATPTPALKSSKKRGRGRPGPPKRPASTRTKRPTRMAMGLDGADDEDDEIEQQFASEYDRFQALTSPKKPIVLGKRVRKSLVDLSQLMDDSEEDDF